MDTKTAEAIAQDAADLLSALDNHDEFRFRSVKWDMLKSAMPALVARQASGFTEDKVRNAVALRAMNGGYKPDRAKVFADEVIADLQGEPVKPEFTEGAVYRRRSDGELFRWKNNHWQRFGSGWQLVKSALDSDDLELIAEL